MLFTSVDPELLAVKTENGRGAWTKQGIEFDHRYMISPTGSPRIGTRAEVSLAHWAVAAGSYAIQMRLIELDHLDPILDSEKGIFGPKTKAAVMSFQRMNLDPLDKTPLTVDGIVGRSDARSMFVPMIHHLERLHGIPVGFLLGQTNHESVLDPGCVGYYIFYPEYRGVDRGMSQINSKFNPQVSWQEAYNPAYSFKWSALRLRSFFDRYLQSYPKRAISTLWDAALCAHNNPAAANAWARDGHAPTEQAAKYVASVKAAIF